MKGALSFQAGQWWVLGPWRRRGKGFALYAVVAQNGHRFVLVLDNWLSGSLAEIFTDISSG
jgi:hypothetical protein